MMHGQKNIKLCNTKCKVLV